MKKIKYFFLNSSMGSKLITYFLVIILLLTFTIVTFGNIMYKNSINNVQNQSTKQMIRQISSNIDFYIKDTENIINYISADPRIVKFLYTSQDDKAKSDAEDAIRSFTSVHPENAGIAVVNKNDTYVSDIIYRISRDPIINEKWYREAEQNPGKIELFSKPVGRNISDVFQYSADDLVSMSKSVTDKQTGKCRGVVLVDMKLDMIRNLIEDVKPGKTGFVYILDSNGEIVYAPVNKVVYRIKNEWMLNPGSKMMIKNINGTDYEIMYMVSSYTGWKTVGVFPLDESRKVATYIMYYSLLIAIITIIISCILSFIFTKSIVKPISKLRRLMKMTEAGNLNVHFNSKYHDEIGQLGNSFNNMIKQIKNLINIVQTEEKNKRKAEINILQAQIKPHFLYNTLDTIQWMAQEHNANDIIEIVENLTNLLRTSLSNGAEIIKVSQEVDLVKSYLTIQKIRYGDKLNYSIKVDDDVMDYNIIKLILQPLVENAIYHGIKEKRGNGLITILGEKKDGKLHFVVTDDGIGMQESKLKEINNMLKSTNTSGSDINYGIYNVNEKIRLTYGDEFGLRYESVYGEGTVVDIWHPIIN